MGKKEEFRKRCKKIIEQLIKKSYPSLRNIKIHLNLWKQPRGSMMATKSIWGYYIFVDSKKYENAGDNILTGGLAHELAHLEHYKKISFLQNFLETIKYIFSKQFRRDVEIKTDKKTIKKGYGKELLINTEFRIKTAHEKDIKYKRQFYMMPNEIKSLMKKKK
ncbi:MAG: hypothetical protein ABIH92_05765 [Nanoarchaeota archaeon]